MTLTKRQKVEDYLESIHSQNSTLKAFITVVDTEARRDADLFDKKLQDGHQLSPAGGLVISIKDNIDVAGIPTTCGSSAEFHTLPKYDAEVSARLRNAGAILIGKVNLHEFAFGGTTQNPHHGLCKNPWDKTRIPGGSSGGSGVSVAARMCDASLGSDTGGSIRIPAALNGVTGLRPTVGRVSNRGSTPVSPRFDTIGPLARDVATVAAVYEAIAGYDANDNISVKCPVDSFAAAIGNGVNGLRIGIPESFFYEDIDAEIGHAMESAIKIFAQLGAEIKKINLSRAKDTQGLMTPMLLADAAFFHKAKLENPNSGIGLDIRERMMIGYNTTGLEYASSNRAKEYWTRDVSNIFNEVDAIITPTVSFAAPPAEKSSGMISTTKDLTRLTFVWSFAEVPAMSIPCGFTSEGLPMGLQLIGPWWKESTLFALGHSFQQETDFHLCKPNKLC